MNSQPKENATTTATPAPATSTALAVRDMLPEWALKPLERFLNNPNFELITASFPVNSKLGYGYEPSISIVTIDPDPNGKEVYSLGQRKDGTATFGYAKPGLIKLALAAGISIGPPRRVDDGKDHDFCHITLMGMMKNESGQPILLPGSKAHYMPHVIASMIEEKRRYPENKSKSDTEMEKVVAHEASLFRRHIVARTETGAILRLMRAFLFTKSGLTREQIARPKVLLRIDWRPDVSDPVVKNFMLEQGARAAMALYGPDRQLEPSGASVVDEESDHETREPAAAAAVAPTPPPVPPPTAEEIGKRAFSEACGAVGLGFVEAADILTQNGGDHAKAAAAIERMTNERANGR